LAFSINSQPPTINYFEVAANYKFYHPRAKMPAIAPLVRVAITGNGFIPLSSFFDILKKGARASRPLFSASPPKTSGFSVLSVIGRVPSVVKRYR
jgi:hypothetical protein